MEQGQNGYLTVRMTRNRRLVRAINTTTKDDKITTRKNNMQKQSKSRGDRRHASNKGE